jgi:hypothetical protein
VADGRPSNHRTVSFAAGAIQFVEQSSGVLFDLTVTISISRVIPRVTMRARPLLGAKLTSWSSHLSLLAGKPESRKAADGRPPVTSTGGLLTSVKSAADDTQVQESRVSVTHS